MSANLVSRALDLLYPERCVACGRFGAYLCARCEAALPAVASFPHCRNCCARWDGGGFCPGCYGLEALEGVAAAMAMEGGARRMVHGLKYAGVRALAARMATHLQPLAATLTFDAAIAVPLHRSHHRRRGFNQAALLLEACALPPGPGRLIRVRNTGTQVGLAYERRRTNVHGAFAYEGPPLNGFRLLIVDDVVTTGATANECARVLRDHGARSVTALAFARASVDYRSPRPPED